ncbi:MAG: alcohol dehydrogenase catalytic domain-containing protein, partial [Pseudonocardia sp.]|nr:alcohol dehydrogenase catalytic domain-containing protein [Pseudonocardia sp.]
MKPEMRAVRFAAFGGPEVLHVDVVAEPGPPERDEILVRVEASSINGTDLGLRRGGPARVATLGRMPFVPGFDVAGEVLACGPAVTAFVPGDRIIA